MQTFSRVQPTNLITLQLVKHKLIRGQTTAKMQIDSQNPPTRRRLKRNDAIADKPQADIVNLDAAGKYIVITRTLSFDLVFVSNLIELLTSVCVRRHLNHNRIIKKSRSNIQSALLKRSSQRERRQFVKDVRKEQLHDVHFTVQCRASICLIISAISTLLQKGPNERKQLLW